MKKVVIYKNNGGRLANQLWNYACVYAYCLEKGYQCSNYAFFRYQNYFRVRSGNWLIDKILSKAPFFISRFIYPVYEAYVGLLLKGMVISDCGSEFMLPPTPNKNVLQSKSLERLENGKNKDIYFKGWLFRNPVGLDRYHADVRRCLRPSDRAEAEISTVMLRAKQKGSKIIGVHIRQGDYKKWQGGKYYFSFSEARKLLDKFLSQHDNQKQVVFIICTDGDFDEAAFNGLNYVRGAGSAVSDLFLLSRTDIILGSNSTYGRWAAYYGGVPFIQFTHH